MSLLKIFNKLEQAFEKNANPEMAIGMEKYMRNQFNYYGINSPLRKKIGSEFLGNYKLEDKQEFLSFIQSCWDHPKREFKYLALDISIKLNKKMDPTFIRPFELLIAKESWWDTVDGLAPHIIGLIIKRNLELREKYCNKWITSENFWYQRSAIILQLKFGELTDFELLKSLILKRKENKEFFVQKAAGWSLRQYSKFNPQAVAKFISQHKFSSLVEREGMKIINKKK